MIIIKSIHIEGFGSIKNLVFPLDDKGLTLIKGSNGAGKTTVFSALCWCLFRVNLKGVTNTHVATWKKLQTGDFKGTRVMVFLEKDGEAYTIARHLSYKGATNGLQGDSNVFIFDKDNNISTALNKNTQQDLIENLLGMDSRTFLNTIVFPQKKESLLSSSDADIRKFFDNFFDFKFIDEAKQRVFEDLTQAQTDLVATQKQQLYTSANIEFQTKTLSEAVSLRDSFEAHKTSQIIKISAEMEVGEKAKIAYEFNIKEYFNKYNVTELESLLQLKIGTQKKINALLDLKNNCNVSLVQHAALEKEKLSISTTLSDMVNAVSELDKEIQELITSNEQPICSACGVELSGENLHKHSETTRTSLSNLQLRKTNLLALVTTKECALQELEKQLNEKGRSSALDEIDRINASITSQTQYLADISADIDNIKQVIALITQLDYKLQAARTRIEDLKVLPIPANVSKIDDIGRKIESLQASSAALLTEEEGLKVSIERLIFWYKTGFSNTGVKSFMFTNMLAHLNNQLLTYTGNIGMSIQFSVDVEKLSKPFVITIVKRNAQVSFDDLSGGEKQRINIVTALALNDILCANVSNINLMVFDEYTESLDEEGVAYMLDLLSYKTNKAIYMVTHNDNLDITGASSVFFNNKNGFTHIVT